jgi:hypothetical protein
MRAMLGICSVMLTILAGCAVYSRGDFNPFTSYGATGVAYEESTCNAKDKNGNCLKVTCKADSAANCDAWAAACLRVDGYFQGSSAGGTCSKIL